MKAYRPLPSCLTIKKSRVEGLGLFATEHIEEGTNLGISHIHHGDEIIRTPLGGFYNHSNTPNCKRMWSEGAYRLVTISNIKKGEELTARYSLYTPPTSKFRP